MRNILLSFFCYVSSLLFFQGAIAAQMQLGVFKLGMKNSEVAKVSKLERCDVEGDRVVCSSPIYVLSEKYDVTLKFNKLTKRLIWMELRLRDWASDDPRMTDAYRELKIQPCAPDMRNAETNWFMKEECFAFPDQIRHISWDGGRDGRIGKRTRSVVVTIYQNQNVYSEFLAKKARDKRRIKQMQANEAFARGH